LLPHNLTIKKHWPLKWLGSDTAKMIKEAKKTKGVALSKAANKQAVKSYSFRYCWFYILSPIKTEEVPFY
jgi:hypothetical protein